MISGFSNLFNLMEVFMKMQILRSCIFLGLLFYVLVPINAVAEPLKGSVIFVRGGIVIELEERLKTKNQQDLNS